MRASPRATPQGAVGATPVPTVALEGVDVVTEERVLLSNVTLTLSARRIAIVGSNGSGKSTFARLLNGTRAPDSGTVRVLGRDVSRDVRALRGEVGFLFTDPAAQLLMPTPAEDVALSLRHLPRGTRAERAMEILADFGLDPHADAPVSTLSGGQRQLLAIASVLATGPELVVADEPTTLLDLRNARRIGDLLLGLDARVILVTHDLELACRCDEAVMFDAGRAVAVGAAAEIVARYRDLHT